MVKQDKLKMPNGFSADCIAALGRKPRIISLPSRSIVWHNTCRKGGFLHVIEGTLKIYQSLEDGRSQVLGFADAGQFLNTHIGEGVACRPNIEAVTPVKLCYMSTPEFATLISMNMEVTKKLLLMKEDELAQAHAHMLLLGQKTSQEKVASFLLERLIAWHKGFIFAGDSTKLEQKQEMYAFIPMRGPDIADYLGLSEETISRTISQFRLKKLIGNKRDKHIRIDDLDRLKLIAEGSSELL